MAMTTDQAGSSDRDPAAETATANAVSGATDPVASSDRTASPDRHEGQPEDGTASRHQMHTAAAQTARRHSTRVRLPFLGAVELPARNELAFIGGVGVLAVVGAIEWPVALIVAAGHTLAANHRNEAVKEFGEALEIV